MKSWLEKNDIEMYSSHNEAKSVVGERFIRTLKNTIYRYMTSVSKNLYINKLDDIVNKYSNTYHSTITMKPVGVKSNTYTDSSQEINDKSPTFEISDTVRISKYKNAFAKVYATNWSEEVFVIKKVKNTVPWRYVFNDFNRGDIVGTFYKMELQETNQKEFRAEKIIKRKRDKLNVNWKDYDNLFNRSIDKKEIFLRTKIFRKVELDLSNYAAKTKLNMQQELIHHLLLKRLI